MKIKHFFSISLLILLSVSCVSKKQMLYLQDVDTINNQELKYVSRKEQTLILPNSSYKLDLELIYKDCQLLIIHFLLVTKLTR